MRWRGGYGNTNPNSTVRGVVNVVYNRCASDRAPHLRYPSGSPNAKNESEPRQRPLRLRRPRGSRREEKNPERRIVRRARGNLAAINGEDIGSSAGFGVT